MMNADISQAKSIDTGSHVLLRAFWRTRRLVPVRQTPPVLSRRNLLWLGVAGVLMIALPTFRPAAAVAEEKKPEKATLIFEVVTDGQPEGIRADGMDKLLKAIDRRLGTGSKRLAKARKLDDRRIEVTLAHPGDADRKRVTELLTRPGTLEFRILANKRDNRDLIAQALADPSKKQILDAKGNWLAKWLPVKKGGERSFDTYGEIARRTVKQDDHDIQEILVVKDDYDVTGAYLRRVETDSDYRGQRCVALRFNTMGGQLFAGLTGNHLPDRATGFTYRLGIILDGELYSAPSIQSTISTNAQLTGSFTEQEVSDLVAFFNAGSLPVRLRLAEPP